MQIKNSTLIDSKRGIFSVLDLIQIQLRLDKPYSWHTEDLDQGGSRGCQFRAFLQSNLEREVASFTVVDVSMDETEPDISSLDDSRADQFDKELYSAMVTFFEFQGMKLTKWMGSQLNIGSESNYLITAYIAEDDVSENQYIAARTSIEGRKVVVIGSFDIRFKEELATL